MSFLDRLKREADQQRAQAEAAQRERDERDAVYKQQIEPRMLDLTRYLEGLVATLMEVKPPVVVKMPIQGYGDLAAQPYWDYKIEHERRHRAFVVNMTWTLRVDPERTPVIKADNVTKVKTLISVFRHNNLGGIKEEKRTPQGEIMVATFHARGYIKASLQAQISAEDPILRMSFNNASWLGTSRRQLPWNQINDGLFDKLARFLVREDDSLFTEEVTGELRQKLGREPEAPVAPRTEPPASPPPAAAPQAAPRIAPEKPAAAVDADLAVALEQFKVQGTVPPPPVMMDGGVIPIDESKLGIAAMADELEDSGFFKPRDLSKLGVAADPRPPAAAPTAPVASSSAAAVRPTAAPVAAPANPQPVVARAPVAPPSATPASTTNLPPETSARSAAPALAAAVTAQGEASDDAKEREAALFRLRVRAMMSKLRGDGSDKKS